MKQTMLKPGNLLTAVKNRRGATAVIVAICLFMLIGFAALAVDVGYLYATRNELQNVADAGALAGAGYLGSVYATLSYSEQQSYTFNPGDVATKVNEVTQKNKAAGVSITINNEDIVIGNWNGSTVVPNLNEDNGYVITPDAVQVAARRDGSANGPITTFLIRIFGTDTANVAAVAVAALTGPANVIEGELNTPFALSECVFPNDCKEAVHFSPTTESCAGWHNFFDPANANRMDEKALGLIKGDGDGTEGNPCLLKPCGQDWIDKFFDMNKEPDAEITPETKIGDDFNFQGGTISSLFLGGVLDTDYNGVDTGSIIGDEKHPAPFPALFDYFRYRDDDDDDSIWTATVPIYKDEVCCTNPSGAIEIAGFAKIVIYMPNPPPDSTVDVYVDCNNSFTLSRGGGSISGNLKGFIPNLVK